MARVPTNNPEQALKVDDCRSTGAAPLSDRIPQRADRQLRVGISLFLPSLKIIS
jgi:hypothetical protein